MGVPAGLLIAAHVLGCAFVAWLGWLYWALSKSEGATPGSNPEFLFLGLPLLLLAVAMWLALVRRRRLVATALFIVEAAIGVVILLRGLELSDRSDELLYVLALAIGLTGIGAIAAAEPSGTVRDRVRP